MGEREMELNTLEAAFAAGVRAVDVDRAIHQGQLPDGFLKTSDGQRFVTPAGCVLLAYLAARPGDAGGTAPRSVVDAITSTMQSHAPGPTGRSRYPAGEGEPRRTAGDAEATLPDLAPVFARVSRRLSRLQAARALVTVTPEILSGTPVIRGTRIPVHYVAATFHEEGLAGAIDAYPNLDGDTVDLAVLYADTHPLPGRPPTRAVPAGARVAKRWHTTRAAVAGARPGRRDG